MVTIRRSEDLEEFARESRRRFMAGDGAWFDQTTAYGEVTSFGTAPGEEARGRDAVLGLTVDQIRELSEAGGLALAETGEIDDGAVEAYEAGDAGWMVTLDKFVLDDGSWVANRVVSLVVRDPDGGGWRGVLTASQLLVPNELLAPGSPLLNPADS
jgi:hypothetical protein